MFFICCFSVTQLCLTLFNPMDCSMPGYPAFHHLLELGQTDVHWVNDAILLSHPLLSSVRRWNQSILKEINPDYSLQGLILKLQYFGHLIWKADSLENTLILGKIEGRRRSVSQSFSSGFNQKSTMWHWTCHLACLRLSFTSDCKYDYEFFNVRSSYVYLWICKYLIIQQILNAKEKQSR